MNYLVRLNVLLQRRGVASRRHADELIKNGCVHVNGVMINQLGTKVPRNARLAVNGVDYRKSPRYSTYIFHKPPFVMSTRNDQAGRKTIFDFPEIKLLSPNIQNVGRLDYHSEGLMILTNDGNLSYALTHPKHDIEKVYAVLLSTSPTHAEIEKLKSGLMLEDGFAKPTHVQVKHHEPLGKIMGQWVEVTVTEGRNRLVRRMFEFFGLTVVRLVRTAIGDLNLTKDLREGHVRLLTTAEKRYLKSVKAQLDTSLDKSIDKS